MSHGFINEPNLYLVLSSQTFLLPVYVWYSRDTSYIYLFLWMTSTFFHSYPSTFSHNLDRVAITVAVLHTPVLMYNPYGLIWCIIPHVYNYIVFVYGYKHKKYFFDSNLQVKTAYHVGMHILASLCLTLGGILTSQQKKQYQ